MYEHLAVLAGFVFLYGVVAGRVEKMALSGPIVFTAFGLLFGPLGFNLLTLDVGAEGMRTLAELTLALVLFTDAAGADLGVLRRYRQLPLRLLLIGLPLTIVLGFGLGRILFPGLTLFEVAILATMLAPTDAALGSAVVSNPKVPASIRQGLNVESGLNDGICVPILFLFLAFATGSGGGEGGMGLALQLLAEEIGIGAAVGLGITLLGGWLIRECRKRGWITDIWQQVLVISMAFSCFALAQVLGGSGFIASFLGGLLFGAIARKHKEVLLHTAEGMGNSLALITWVVFGAAVVGNRITGLDWQILLYTVLALTVVRMLPVFLCLVGTGVSTGGKLFMGWFGPRGLASVVFIVIVLEEDLPGGPIMSVAVVTTVILSIVAHGITANPLARRMQDGG
jgi:NhaP-type Na+/H+ or K+/H+ antiporter